MTVREAVKFAKEELKNVPDRDVDAAWIVTAATGLTRSEIHFEGESELSERQISVLENMIARRKTREPLQYIFGEIPFYNVMLKTDRRALIPRDETSLLVEEALSAISSRGYKSVLDMCTGSGAIAVAVKANCECHVTASDISEDALSLARENAEKNGVDIDFIQGDLFENVSGKFDVILSNPPYVATKDMEKLERELSFEPENALDGGCDGLDFYRDIISEAPEYLNKGGLIMLEIGYDQAAAVRTLFAKNGFTDVTVLKDYDGHDRIAYTFYEE